MNHQNDNALRGPSDRRRTPTRPWDFLFTPARRRSIRRADDPASHPYHFVDRPGPSTTLWTLSLIFLTLLDGVLTLLIINDDQGEANPLMAFLIRRGALWFILGKYALTVAALPVLLIFKNYRMFGTRVRVGHSLPVFVSLYLILTFASALALLASSGGSLASYDGQNAAAPTVDRRDVIRRVVSPT
jgi:Domain of unknown function (DUF5658)